MTASFPADVQPLLLMSFLDVLKETFRGKQFEYSAQPAAPVPVHILKLWRERGYEPSSTGVALVTFINEGKVPKAYSFPLYFWQGT